MIKNAEKINPAIDIFTTEIIGIDNRLAKNIATVLAGAYVCLNEEVPTNQQASEFLAKYPTIVQDNSEPLERDDAIECFDHLISHVVEKKSIGQWLAENYRFQKDGRQNLDLIDEAGPFLANFGIRVRVGENSGILIANRNPNVEKAFNNSVWANGAWMKALKKIDGVEVPEHPQSFPGLGKKRCTILPIELLPEHVKTLYNENF